jgi:hypothetical protein
MSKKKKIASEIVRLIKRKTKTMSNYENMSEVHKA